MSLVAGTEQFLYGSRAVQNAVTDMSVIKIVVKKEDGRHRAYAYINDHLIGRWWIESTTGKRYKPLKPMPPLVRMLVERLLHPQEVEQLALFLITAGDGDTWEKKKILG